MAIRVGVIGMGVGEAHIPGYEKSGKCLVRGICDFNPRVLDRVRAKYPGAYTTLDADQILTDPEIDVVSIASFDQYHAAQTVKALQNGKHVFVEKPLCLFPGEAREIYKALKADAKLQLSSNLILRRSPRFLDLKERIDKGDLGSLFHLDGAYDYGRIEKVTDGWRTEEPFHSVFYGGAVHITDLMVWMLNSRVEEVAAFGNRKCTEGSKFRFNDHTVALMKFRNGCTATVSANYGCVHPHFHRFQVYGTKATFINGINGADLFSSRDPKLPPEKVMTPYPGVQKGDLIAEFIEAIEAGCSPGVGAKDVFDVMAICFAIEEAVTRQSTVKVDYLWEE